MLEGIPVHLDGHLFFVDRRGQIVLKTQQLFLPKPTSLAISEPRVVPVLGYAFKVGKNYGFLDANGDWLVEPRFTMARAFAGALGQYGVTAGYHSKTGQPYFSWGLIDRQGRCVTQPEFAEISRSFRGSRLVLCKAADGWSAEGPWRAIDDEGHFTSDPVVGDLRGFNWVNPPWPMKLGDRFGYVDARASIVIEPAFDYAFPFYEDKALVIQGDRAGFIDPSGKLVIDLKLPSPGGEAKSGLPAAFNFRDGMARYVERIENQKCYGYVNAAGAIAIPPRYRQTWLFGDGRGPVSLDGKKSGYVDHSGALVIEPRFQYAMSFSCERAVVQVPVSIAGENGKKRRVLRWGAIDTQGRVVVETKFKILGAFDDGIALAEDDDERQFLLDDGGRVLLADSQ